MIVREVLRRALIWALVAVHLVCGLALFAVTGEYWTLAAWGGFTVVGAIILNARSGNWIGRIMLAIGLYWPVSTLIVAPRWVADVPVWLEMLVEGSGFLAWMAVPLLVLVYPNGRIDTMLGRATAWLLAAISAIALVSVVVDPSPLSFSGRPSPLGWAPAGPAALWIEDAFLALAIAIVIALVDLVLRWRRAGGAERLQFRWLVYGTAVTIATLLLTLPDLGWIGAVVILGINAIPISIGIAVTRHGLYEIGRVVSRTVTYAAVTLLAIGVYALVVTSVSLLLPVQSAIPVALATLTAAALFLPVLRWVQRRLDRRFDRERYDAEKVVDAFGQRLRTGADPASTVPELVETVERALQPASVGIWMTGGRR